MMMFFLEKYGQGKKNYHYEIEVSALMAQNLFPQLKSHFILGKEHGLTKKEAVEIVTHLSFYCSWASAWNAFALIKEVYGEDE